MAGGWEVVFDTSLTINSVDVTSAGSGGGTTAILASTEDAAAGSTDTLVIDLLVDSERFTAPQASVRLQGSKALSILARNMPWPKAGRWF